MADCSAATLVRGSDARILLLCDHASNQIPPGMQLGLDAGSMQQHIAWDIGAAAITRSVAAALDCRAWLANVSRLVVDCNRPPDLAIPERSDGLVIPGNVGLSQAERAMRLALHSEFHDGIDSLITASPPVLLVSLHSFTPALASAPAPRPWPVALLWNRDFRAAELGLAALAAEQDLGGPVGANEPYSGKVLNYTMDRHAEANGIPYLGFEIRQDLIDCDAGVARWSAIVSRTITTTLEGLWQLS